MRVLEEYVTKHHTEKEQNQMFKNVFSRYTVSTVAMTALMAVSAFADGRRCGGGGNPCPDCLSNAGGLLSQLGCVLNDLLSSLGFIL